jgi:hypothetical protein
MSGVQFIAVSRWPDCSYTDSDWPESEENKLESGKWK